MNRKRGKNDTLQKQYQVSSAATHDWDNIEKAERPAQEHENEQETNMVVSWAKWVPRYRILEERAWKG
jgi:hypothetical protein